MSVSRSNENESGNLVLTPETIATQKEQLNTSLNQSMTELYALFGSSNNPKIQQMVQMKLNELKRMVGQIEKVAKDEHMKIDTICDQKQKQIAEQEKLKHNKTEQDKQALQKDCTRQFKEWMQSSSNQQKLNKQTAQNIVEANKSGDIVVKF
mmetsp:Transcript_11359/g.10180  ORF Transcript_11359/g.10180 Transcript_11359/m.10180 type:complete len:152 (-) Transcript_11359:67-522(-)